MTAILIALAALAALALVAAGVFFGLWQGERGRNADLRAIQNVRLEPPPPAVVRQVPDAEVRAYEMVDAEGREALIEDIMKGANCSRERAEAEAERMIGLVRHMGSEPLP